MPAPGAQLAALIINIASPPSSTVSARNTATVEPATAPANSATPRVTARSTKRGNQRDFVAANVTVTLPSGADYIGRTVTIKNLSGTYTVISASSNVKPLNSGTAGTAILAATAGKFATLVCEDGTNWVIMAAA